MSEYTAKRSFDDDQATKADIKSVDGKTVAGSSPDDAGSVETTFESQALLHSERALRKDIARYPNKGLSELADLHGVPVEFAEYVQASRGPAQFSVDDLEHELICMALLHPEWTQPEIAAEAEVAQPTVSVALSTLSKEFDISRHSP